MFLVGQICNENYYPFRDVMDDVTEIFKSMFAIGKIVNQLYQCFAIYRVIDLHLKIQTNFGQISSTQQ